jgi:hypothetical protein
MTEAQERFFVDGGAGQTDDASVRPLAPASRMGPCRVAWG